MINSEPSGVTEFRNRNITKRKGLWILLTVFSMLLFSTFTLPGRVVPESLTALDWIAIIKVITRLASIILLGIYLLKTVKLPHDQRIVLRLLPFGIFASWAIISTIWSPMKTVSLGHAGEILLFVMFSVGVGIATNDDKSLSLFLCYLTIGFLIFSSLFLALHYIDPTGLGNLNRSDGPAGIMTPGPLGDIASGGLIMFVGCRLLWEWSWTRRLILPKNLLQTWLLLLAHGRVSIILTFLFLISLILLLGNRKLLIAALLIFSFSASIYLFVDPNMELFEDAYKETSVFMARGQTKDDIINISGRTELWSAVWDSFCDSPIVGHGYFMASRTGKLDIWGNYLNITTHNMGLQVLVSTGIIGAILLAWAMWCPLAPIVQALRGRSDKKKVAALVLIVVLWFFALGLTSSSFLDSVQPSSFLFFASLGIAAGRL